MYTHLLVEKKNSITRLTIHRPESLNALNKKLLEELDDALSAAERDGTRVLILTGSGDKAFIAGADIKEMTELSAQDAAHFSKFGQSVFRRFEISNLVAIAAVNGFALGGGCELMLACDFAIASQKAKFGQPEVSLGVTPGFGGSVRLSRRVGEARARQLLLTGAMLNAEEALRIALVNEVVPQEQLLERVYQIAEQIESHAPYAVELSKQAARLGVESDLDTAVAFESRAFGLCFSTHDQKEGMRAFMQKRPPKFIGK